MEANGNNLKLDGTDIAKVLAAKGPVVKCVLLRARGKDGENPCQRHEPQTSVETAGKAGEEDMDISPASNGDDCKPKAIDTDCKIGDKKNTASGQDDDPSTQEEKKDSRDVSTPGEAAASSSSKEEDADSSPPAREILSELIDEIEIDTTPSKSMVSKTLGGPFTFLGQYEEEGIVLMVRQQDDDDEEPFDEMDPNEQKEFLSSSKLADLRLMCQKAAIPTDTMLEKSELVNAIIKHIEQRRRAKETETNAGQPKNPHQLQPPLHNSTVRGDILVMKVAATKEELDGNDDNNEDEQTDPNEEKQQDLSVLTNEEFFLDYTKDEYVAFAARTDIPVHELPAAPDHEQSDDEEEEGEDGEDDEEDGDDGDQAYVIGDDDNEVIDEDDKPAMLNFVMNEVLRKYREDNGRGPDTRELLELRAAIAKQLDVEVAEVDAVAADWDQKTNRALRNGKRKRKIAFSSDTKSGCHATAAPAAGHADEDENDDNRGESSHDDSEPPQKKCKTSPYDSSEEGAMETGEAKEEANPPESKSKESNGKVDDPGSAR